MDTLFKIDQNMVLGLAGALLIHTIFFNETTMIILIVAGIIAGLWRFYLGWWNLQAFANPQRRFLFGRDVHMALDGSAFWPSMLMQPMTGFVAIFSGMAILYAPAFSLPALASLVPIITARVALAFYLKHLGEAQEQ